MVGSNPQTGYSRFTVNLDPLTFQEVKQHMRTRPDPSGQLLRHVITVKNYFATQFAE